MNYEGARLALVTALSNYVSATNPTLPVIYEDQETVDLESIGDVFVKVDIKYDNANNVGIGVDVPHRVTGFLLLIISTKEGTGTIDRIRLMDTMTNLFKNKNLGGLNTKVPTPLRKQRLNGWTFQELGVPFWFDSIS